MEYTFEIRKLSSVFYNAYTQTEFPEILEKPARPYTCLLIETQEDYLICVPFRSNINHNNAFLFKNTARSNLSHSGLDYKKLVLIKDESFIDRTPAIVDNDEYLSTVNNIARIVSEVNQYILTYVNHVNGTAVLHSREFQRRYSFSTLPYFHDILGLTK